VVVEILSRRVMKADSLMFDAYSIPRLLVGARKGTTPCLVAFRKGDSHARLGVDSRSQNGVIVNGVWFELPKLNSRVVRSSLKVWRLVCRNFSQYPNSTDFS
jgi:hypothetical protein